METQRRESNLPRRVRENFSWAVSLEVNKCSSLQLAGLPFIHSSLMCWVPRIVLDAVHTTSNKTKSLPAWCLHSGGGSGWHFQEKLRMVPSDHPISTLWPHFLSHVYFPETRVPWPLKWEHFDLFGKYSSHCETELPVHCLPSQWDNFTSTGSDKIKYLKMQS